MDIREQIDQILSKPIGEAEVKFLVENMEHLTDDEVVMLGFIKPKPTAGPEIPSNDRELAEMPRRTPEEIEEAQKSKKKGK